MKNLVFIAFVLLLAFACDKDEVVSLDSLSGIYKGYFNRASPFAKYQRAEVTLNFTDNTFEGSSSIDKYPAICKGTYQLADDSVTFNNECFFTADFDWTYILSGKFKIYKEGEELIITRSYEGSVTDTYRLKKSMN